MKELRKPNTEARSKEDRAEKEMMLPRQNKNAIRIMINNDDDAEDIAEKRELAQKEYGLADEPQMPVKRPPMKEDQSLRKNPINSAKNQPKVETKSTSVSKNSVANSLSGHRNTMGNVGLGNQPQMMVNKGQNVNNNPPKRGPGM